jgi:hypothetical protein
MVVLVVVDQSLKSEGCMGDVGGGIYEPECLSLCKP